MLRAKIYVMLKPSVLDPQGTVITNALHTLGYGTICETRISKYLEMLFDSEDMEQTRADLEIICDKVLANPNTEIYHYELEREHAHPAS